MTTLRVMRYAFLSGARDYGSIYTWKTWLGGWFLRVLAQVTFFALLGRLLRSDEQTSGDRVGKMIAMPDRRVEGSRRSRIFGALIDVGDVVASLGVLALLLVLLILCLCGPVALWIWNN